MTFAGGCLCGQVRWRTDARPANIRICHCRLCQKATGGPFFARAIFPGSGFQRGGETTGWNSSPRIERQSCARCGTPMFAVPNDPPDRIGVSLATADDPDALRPECHIWTGSRRAWVVIDDSLPQFPEGFPTRPPGTA